MKVSNKNSANNSDVNQEFRYEILIISSEHLNFFLLGFLLY